MLFPNSNRKVLSGSRIRMRTADRGQDVRPEKTSLFEFGKKTHFSIHKLVDYVSTVT